jgi:NAD(P)-dependent dehydrogenase (short-subunit alcohol dehydrogenase family)
MAQRVLITAGAAGIGKEIARAFAANGATVCVCDIDVKALDTAAKDIPGLKTIVCDVSKRQDIERMVASAVEALGGLDVLVNNAGIAGPTAPVEDVDPDRWEAVMTVDVIGTFHVTRLAIPHLKKSAAGSIVVMSSLGGRFGYPNRSAYCTAKMGLIGFAKTLSRELGQYNIRCNAIAPGAVGGDRMERVLQGRAEEGHKTLDEARGDAMSVQSLKRFVDPKDIAALVVFLTSDSGKSISGQVLPIDNDAQTSAY